MSGTTDWQVLDALEDPIILLDERGSIKQVNDAAVQLMPTLSEGIGVPLESTMPSLAELFEAVTDDGVEWNESGDGSGVESSQQGVSQSNQPPTGDSPTTRAENGDLSVVSLEDNGSVRYFLPSSISLSIGPHEVGRALVLREVTAIERQRREIERQNNQFDHFASAIAHELRNTLTVTRGNLDIAERNLQAQPSEAVSDAISTASRTTDRMLDIVNDLMKAARYSRAVIDPAELSFSDVAERAWKGLDDDSVTLTITFDGTIHADETRFGELVRNAGRLAAGTDATTLYLGLTNDGFKLRTDGKPIPGDDPERALEYGTAVPNSETGLLLPNIRTLAHSHGWSISVKDDVEEGIHVTISGADVVREDSGGIFAE